MPCGNQENGEYSTLEESTDTLLLGTFHWLSDNASHAMHDTLNTAPSTALLMATWQACDRQPNNQPPTSWRIVKTICSESVCWKCNLIWLLKVTIQSADLTKEFGQKGSWNDCGMKCYTVLNVLFILVNQDPLPTWCKSVHR